MELGGKTFSLGTKADAHRGLLHRAHREGDPWRTGRELLDHAGSSADRVRDLFKSIVTDVYKSRIEFRSIAQNLFATNNLPAFPDGVDRGVQSRLLVISFNRTIPK